MDRLTLRSRVFIDQSNTLLVRTFLQYGQPHCYSSERQLIVGKLGPSLFNALGSGVTRGQLIVQDDEGEHVFGKLQDMESESAVCLTVTNNAVWGQVFLSHDLGFAEAYMQGHIEVSDLKGLLNLFLDNRTGLDVLSSSLNSVFQLVSSILSNTILRQNLTMAKRSAQISYDVSNTFMECFLSKEMMYSAALWDAPEHGPRGDLTHGLKARLRPGDRLLEIGSGWGAMAIEAGRMGCAVDTITLSKEQKMQADERIAAAGLAESVRVHLCDYRELPPAFEHSFDACISCEMLEAVGYKNYGAYFRTDRATVVISSTTQPESRYSEYQPEDFARRYHWPNNFAPSPTSLVSAVQAAIPRKFVVFSVEDHGIHYCRTLREWGRRFQRNFKGAVLEHMQEEYPFLRDPKESRNVQKEVVIPVRLC
ncbi:Mycolic acid cyclopropane synthetase-domain-containing protein [Mycena olivaceomarginata]|nr:Mycolic acid cyclopropane synthetase-domain-containing protein [Mycena olivaceomarginata]